MTAVNAGMPARTILAPGGGLKRKRNHIFQPREQPPGLARVTQAGAPVGWVIARSSPDELAERLLET